LKDIEKRGINHGGGDIMGEVVVVTSGKGGVGKTTATANIGTALAALGKKVALVDTDIGLRKLDLVLGLENRIVFNLIDVTSGNCRLKQALIRDKRLDGLYFLPAAQTRDKTAVTPEQMRSLCEELKKEFDYVLVDCPAGIEQGFKNAVAGADRALVVTNPEISSVRDADRIIGLLEASEIRDTRLIVNRIRPVMVKQGNMLDVEDILDNLRIDLIGIVPEDETILISTNRGEPAVLNSHSKAGMAFSNIAQRITGEEVPFMNLEVREGWRPWFRKLFSFGSAR
jgi:septum site-determining protein MinD